MYVNRVSSNHPYRNDRFERNDDLAASYDNSFVGEHETPLERFVKDATAGALRGLFREMYEFWRRYRIR